MAVLRRRRAVDKVGRFADRIDAKLRADERSTKTMRVFTDASLRRVVQQAGFERRGSRNLALIEAALKRRGVFADPPLTRPGLDWEERIYFTRTPQEPRSTERRIGFRTERDLEEFLVDNFDLVWPDLRLEGRQWEVQSGKIDLLARDDDGYVVIELKKDRPTKDLVHAVARYIEDVEKWVAERGRSESVRGLIVTGQHDARMHEQLADLALARGHQIDWQMFRLEMVMEPVMPGASGDGENQQPRPPTSSSRRLAPR